MTQVIDVDGHAKQTPDFPTGLIIVFYGSVIPEGFALCVTGDTLVALADGTTRRIDEIVQRREPVEVLTFNEDSGEVEPATVTDWFEGSSTRDDWLRLKIYKGKGEGARSLNVTRNHPVWVVGSGWRTAEEVRDGDQILRYESGLTLVGQQAITGILLGDGSLRSSGTLTLRHGEPQKPYLEHIAEKLDSRVYAGTAKSGYGKGFNNYSLSFSLRTVAPELETTFAGAKVTPTSLASLGPVGLAYWYMDDGNLQSDDRAATPTERAQLHTEGFEEKEIDLILEYLRLSFNISADAYRRNNTKGRLVRLSRSGSEIFWQMIAPYVHPVMRYKLPPRYRAIPYLLDETPWREKKPVPFFVTKSVISDLCPSQRNRRVFQKRYDIKVSKNASFIANGFVVHNCDGNNQTPDLRDRFIVGASAVGLGSASGSVSATSALTHAGAAVGAHSAHSVTQPNPHDDHVVTQPTAHDTHAITQAADHATHAVNAGHTHDAHATATSLAGATSVIADGFTHSSDGVHAHDAHSAHTGADLDAHSAHSTTGLNAHSVHSATALDGHSAHGVTQPSTHAILKTYLLVFLMKT